MKRYHVFEQRNGRMEYLGTAPAAAPQDAISTVRRYTMRDESIRMTAKPAMVTKR